MQCFPLSLCYAGTPSRYAGNWRALHGGIHGRIQESSQRGDRRHHGGRPLHEFYCGLGRRGGGGGGGGWGGKWGVKSGGWGVGGG